MTRRQSAGALWVALAWIAACRRGSTVPEGYQGLLEYDERAIGFEQAGRVAEVPVHRGQAVKPGDLLARLDDTLAIATRDARQAELDVARAELALLKAGTRREEVAAGAADVTAAAASEAMLRRTAERSRALLRSSAIPQAEADKAAADFAQASARRASLENRLTALRHGARPEEIARAAANVQDRASALGEENDRIARYLLRAPGAGTILDVTVKPGEIAAPGTPAVLMADIEHPYADVFVPEGQLGVVQVGDSAGARVDAVDERFNASVEYVSPQTEFTPKFVFSDRERPNLVIRVRIRIGDPHHRLHSGVPVFVRLAR